MIAAGALLPRTRHAGEIVDALARLDARLDAAIALFDRAYDGPSRDRFRGLYVTSRESRRLLAMGPGGSTFEASAADEPLWTCRPGSAAQRFVSTCGLSDFDLGVLLIAAAPDIDLRYERVFAYLQDDVTRKRPTIDLMLSLLCVDAAERVRRRRAFASDAPLRRSGLVTLGGAPAAASLAQAVVPDPTVVRLMLGEDLGEPEWGGRCVLEYPSASIESLGLPDDCKATLAAFARSAADGHVAPRVWLSGPSGVGKKTAAEALARAAGVPLLIVDAQNVPDAEIESALQRAARDAVLLPALLYLRHADAWLDEPAACTALSDALPRLPGAIAVGSLCPMPAAAIGTALRVDLPMPGPAVRAACWRRCLSDQEATASEATVFALASRFRLTAGQIASAVSDAMYIGTCRGDNRHDAVPELDAALLQAAARHQSGQALAAVADKIDCRAVWSDLVLPPDTLQQLREVCDRAGCRDRVLTDWGFGAGSARGRGVTALFAGSSGTGKTMAAEVMATALGLDLYRIDLARVVSKYIGETEKNLDRVFAAAADSNAILFFDEADALFGKRSDVKDSHDRYANLEVAYLLQKMEDYDGLAILASNLREHLDDAFLRRLSYIVHFPFPDEGSRLAMWHRVWPREAPRAADLDLGWAARHLRLSGGAIRNVAVTAAYLAAAESGEVTPARLVRAVRRELDKLGADVPPAVVQAEAASARPAALAAGRRS